MTSQRQSGLQHLLEVLGLSQWGWQLAWMMAGLPLMGASFAVEGLLASTTYLRLVEPGLLATAMGAAALAAAGWAVLLGCCFRDPKVAATGSFVVTMASGLPFLALYTAAPTQLLAAKRICCLFWPFAISALLQRMAAGHQLRRYGADRQVSAVPGLDWASATHAPLSTVEILGFMLFDAVLYLVAAAVLAACRNMLGGAGFWGISGGRRHGEEAGGRRAGDRGRTAALELRGVTHRYPGNERRALDDVSLSVAAGEALALVGRNAAGKSTLMAISCGRIVPNGGGTVHVADSVMYGGGGRGGCLGESVYRHIGYCPQGNVLLHDMTALEHLYLALVLRGGENWTWGLLCFRGRRRLAAAAAKLARLVSLPDDMLQLLVSELSGGSRRKLQLAMAMAGEPPLLLLDEITAGVDTQSSQAIWEALLAAKQGPWGTDIHGTPGGKGGGGAAAEKAFGDRPMGRGAALLFISHHLAEVETLADWLGVMDGGRLQSLTSASALRALVRGGGQRVLRITTRPAPPPPAHVAAIAPPNPISDTLQHGLPHATTLCPTFTRSQLLDLVVQHLGSNTVRLLYSNLTFTAVFMGSPVSTMMATAAAAKAKRDSSTTAAADPSPSPLESLLRALSPQQPNEASTDGDAGAVMATATAITTAAVGGAQLGGAHLSGWSRGGNSLWEAQPLVVVRCGVGVPALEDVLLLGLHGLEVRGEGQTLDMRDQGPMQVGATEVSGKGGEASAPAASASASAIISAAATASLRLREGGDDDGSKLSALSGAVGTAISQVTSAGRHDPDDQRHGGPGPQSYPGPRPDVAVASSGGCGALLGNLVASLPPLLTKHRLIWLRDRSSSARLLLLPVMVVGLAILALSIRPSSTGPPAPLHLAWLGQDQPLPVAGLPQAWRHAAGAAAASVAGGGLDGLANSSSSIETLAAASDVSTVPEAASKLLGLVPLKAEWMRAAGLLVDPDREPSSFDTSSWFVSRSKVTAVGKEAERGSMADEPLAPLQAAMVFNDVVTARLNRTAWASLGFLIETMLAPAEYERLNVTDFPAVRRAIEIVRHEDGAMWKMLDFLYDRILLHEVISLARYITGSAAKGGSVTSDAILQGRTFTGSAQRSLAAADGAAMSNGSAATGSADGGKASPGSNIRGGGLFSFFRLAELLDLCQLKVPDSEQKDEALLQSGGGGRALLMSYRPTLNVTFYLLAGLLPPEPRFCPLARHLVEHSVTTAQAARHYMARRKLPVVNLMWNISSPHGLPATLNHLHNTLLHLRMDPQSAHSTATSTSHDQKPPSGGISIGSINRIMQGRSKESALYSQRVYADTAIRVRNYPLPARGTTASLAGLLDHLMLAVVVAMPLSYTTGSFVVRAASEAASGAKQQQLAARRVGPLSYWLSFWLTDLALYSLITAGVMGLMLVGGTAAFVGSPARCGGFAALLVTFAAASLPWGYCIGLRCASPASAQGLVSTTGLVAGVALALARQVLAHVVRWSWLADMLLPLLRLLPPFCLVDGLVQMSLLDVIVAFSDLLGRRATKRGFVRSILAGHLVGIDPSNPSPFQSSVLGDNLSYLAFDTLLYFAILLVVEWQASRGGLFAVLPGWRMLQRLYVTLKSTAVAVAAFCAVLCGRRVAEDGDLRNVKDDYEPGHTVGTAKARLRRVKQADFSDDSDPRFIGETLARMTARELAPGEVLKTSRSGGEDSEVSEQEGGYLVVVRNVRKEYGSGRGRLVALGGLSLQLRRGECYALIGRNGAGKSTAMGVLSGRLRPSEGSVMVGGVQVAGRPQAARGRVALCPQTNPLLPHLTSLEHLVLYSALYGITSAGYDTDRVRTLAGGAAALLPVEASAVAARCRLPVELFHRPAGQLSGGSQRKLSLAIALLGGPQLLLLDEPSAGLDPPARRDVCDAINMALRGWSAASGNSGGGGAPDAPAVVLTTHYAEEAMALCDVVGVLEDGTLLASGPPEQVPQRLRAVRPGHYLADPEEWGAVLTSLLGPCGEKDDAGVFR
ncbi:hypothetical protein Vretifemale_3536 [Volvox reticuliferus]|nr:hypothetical protein Vretifemale_3536 [Volvox reticuliferus]